MTERELIIIAQKLGWSPKGKPIALNRGFYQRYVRGTAILWIGDRFYVFKAGVEAVALDYTKLTNEAVLEILWEKI